MAHEICRLSRFKGLEPLEIGLFWSMGLLKMFFWFVVFLETCFVFFLCFFGLTFLDVESMCLFGCLFCLSQIIMSVVSPLFFFVSLRCVPSFRRFLA